MKTRPSTPPVISGARAESNGITIQAEAITDEDFLNDTFDGNLILAGILPVRAMIKNEGAQPIILKKARFEVRPTTGKNFKLANARSAFKRLISYYGISTYSKEGYEESLSTLSSYALDLEAPLAAGESRQGLMFFKMQSDDVRGLGLTLVANKLRSDRAKNDEAIELKLN